MTVPVIDFLTGPADAAGVSTLIFSATTTVANELLLIFTTAQNAGGAGFSTVTGIAATGLTFVSYGSVQQARCANPFNGATEDMRLEVWSAPVAVAATYSITITFSGTTAGLRARAVGVKSVYDTLSWFDGDPLFPVTKSTAGGGASNAQTVSYTTDQADDLLIFSAAQFPGGSYVTPSGWSLLFGPNAGAGSNDVMYTKTNTATETGATVTADGGSFFGVASGLICILVAATADAKGFKFQTFVSFCSSG